MELVHREFHVLKQKCRDKMTQNEKYADVMLPNENPPCFIHLTSFTSSENTMSGLTCTYKLELSRSLFLFPTSHSNALFCFQLNKIKRRSQSVNHKMKHYAGTNEVIDRAIKLKSLCALFKTTPTGSLHYSCLPPTLPQHKNLSSCMCPARGQDPH